MWQDVATTSGRDWIVMEPGYLEVADLKELEAIVDSMLYHHS